MRTLSIAGVILLGATIGACPISLHWSSAHVPSLSIDKADARIGRPLTPLSVAGVNRRVNRRAYYRGAAGYAYGRYGHAYGYGAYRYGAYRYGAYRYGGYGAGQNYAAYSDATYAGYAQPYSSYGYAPGYSPMVAYGGYQPGYTYGYSPYAYAYYASVIYVPYYTGYYGYASGCGC